MPFRGETPSLPLSDVFQNLLQNKQTGTLTVTPKEGKPIHVYFRDGAVHHLSPGRDSLSYLPAVLRKRAGVTDEEIEKAVKKRGRSQKALAQFLVKAGALDDEKARAALQFFGEEQIYDLFAADSAAFEFVEGAPPADRFDPDQLAYEMALDTNKVLFEAARRQDEWKLIRRKILSLDEVFSVPEERRAVIKEGGDRSATDIAKLLDGSRTVREVIDTSAHGAFAVCRAIVSFLEQGHARPVAVDELKRLAETAKRRGDVEAVVRFCRRALEQERNRPDIRELLAEALEKAGDREKAATEWKLLSQSAIEGRDVERGIAAYRRAIACLPRDVSARESLVRLLQERKGPDAAIPDGRDLALTYRELGLLEKARDTYRRLLEMAPGDPEMPRLLAESHVEMGDVAGGTKVLLETAKGRAETGNTAGAMALLKALLKIAPEHAEGKALAKDIETGELTKKKGRAARRRRLVVGTVLVLALGAYGAYHELALVEAMDVEAKAIERLLAGDREGAAKLCETGADSHPLSWAGLLLRERARLFRGEAPGDSGGPPRDPPPAPEGPRSPPPPTTAATSKGGK
ncbi:MAG: DUF4388 domain-containing protein [Planctomycetales bacterium]|nr:DUF4388 domain-containing protein [Planctomycetales bacterium]